MSIVQCNKPNYLPYSEEIVQFWGWFFLLQNLISVSFLFCYALMNPYMSFDWLLEYTNEFMQKHKHVYDFAMHSVNDLGMYKVNLVMRMYTFNFILIICVMPIAVIAFIWLGYKQYRVMSEMHDSILFKPTWLSVIIEISVLSLLFFYVIPQILYIAYTGRSIYVFGFIGILFSQFFWAMALFLFGMMSIDINKLIFIFKSLRRKT
jgi:hypothetical protein